MVFQTGRTARTAFPGGTGPGQTRAGRRGRSFRRSGRSEERVHDVWQMDRRAAFVDESPNDLDSEGIRARVLYTVGDRRGRVQSDGFLCAAARADTPVERSGRVDSMAVQRGANSFGQGQRGNETEGPGTVAARGEVIRARRPRPSS